MNRISKIINNPKAKFYYTIVLVSVLSVLISSIAVYTIIRRNLLNKIVQDSASSLITVMDTHDSILSQAGRIIFTIASDPDMISYMDIYSSGSQVKLYDTYNSLERICRENEYFESITAYYIKDKRILATGWGTSTLEDYLMYKPGYNFYEADGRFLSVRTTPMTDRGQTGEISFVGSLPVTYVFEPKAMIYINISSEYFKSLHSAMNNLGGDYFLMDGSNNLIYGSISGLSEDITSLIAEADFSGGNIYYTTSKIDGKEQLFSMARSEAYGLIYAYCIPMSVITADVSFLMYTIIVVMALVIAIVACGGLFTVRQLYKPLDSIVDVITDYNRDTEPEPFAPKKIAQAIRNIYEENRSLISLNKDLELFSEKYKHYQMNYFLIDLLNYTYDYNTPEFTENMNFLEIAFNEDELFSVVLFSIDNFAQYRKTVSSKQRNLFVFYLLELAAKEFSYAFTAESAEIESGEVCFLLNNKSGYTASSMQAHILASTRLVHERISRETGISLTGGVSEPRLGYGEIPECYKQAQILRNNRWLSGLNRVYAYNAKDYESTTPRYPFDIERRLNAALKSGKQEEGMECLLDFHAFIKKCPNISIGLARQYYLQMLSSSYRCIYESYDMLISSLPVETEVYQSFIGERTEDEMYQSLMDFHGLLFGRLEHMRTCRHSRLADQIKTYIESNHGADLTIDMIGDAFMLSSSHLRKIFKESAGVSVKSYVDECRMANARELLLSTGKSISDVAAQSGYLSPQTFVRVFRKEYGMTPTEFRRYRQTKLKIHE